jgi:aminopeptidase N
VPCSPMSITSCSVVQVATKAYEFYAKYTGVRLPLPKLDMVAVPGRTHAEPHWGLALFDERRLLYNKVICFRQLQRVMIMRVYT